MAPAMAETSGALKRPLTSEVSKSESVTSTSDDPKVKTEVTTEVTDGPASPPKKAKVNFNLRIDIKQSNLFPQPTTPGLFAPPFSPFGLLAFSDFDGSDLIPRTPGGKPQVTDCQLFYSGAIRNFCS